MYANNNPPEVKESLTDMMVNENDAMSRNNSIDKEICNNTEKNQSNEESLNGSVTDGSDCNFGLPYNELRRCAQTESELSCPSDNSDQQRGYSWQNDDQESIKDNGNEEPEITKTSPSKRIINKNVINYCHRVDGIRVLTETLVVSEEIDENKTSGFARPNVPSTITDLTQLWIKERLEPDPFFRNFSMPLHVLMFSKSQLNVIDYSRSAIIVHLDGTGANVKPINEIKEKHIFYYAMLYRAKARTIPLCELITSQHNIPSISTMLREYRKLVETLENKWPFFNAIVTDWSWVLMNSVLEEWNRMSMNAYLDVAYSYLIDKKKKRNQNQ
ncbi:hypothetical protein KQX54_000147 [Cotesia glomerata]|uniref:Uncharacterized protein n=1 Tax=Cotesia glomerata TaxID=32391 RepID=A0AAV7I3U5_COTGL|nr:hypothetical protein KQX54_000147 [Cotesia glomerata]